MKNTVKKIFSSHYFPFFLFTIAITIFHLMINVNFADDLIFKTYLDQFELREFLTLRYNTWTSRIIIEAVLVNVVRMQWLWKIIDIIVMVWIPVAFSLFFNLEKSSKINWCIILIFAFFPYSSMCSAGWMATTLNYLWPLSFGLLAIMPLRNALYQKRTPWYLYIICIIALIYASNQEQVCAILIAINVFFGGYIVFRDKKIPWFTTVQLLIEMVSVLFILTCPGNDNRITLESQAWFPQFMELSFLQKIELGYIRTMYAMVMRINIVFSVFSVLLFVAVVKSNKKIIFCCISAFPLVASLIMGALVAMCKNFKNTFYPSEYGAFEFGNTMVEFAMLAATAVAVCVIISLIFVFKKSLKTLISLAILGIGFAVSVVLGFSPTLWASSYRIFLFLNVAFMAVSIKLIMRINEIIREY